MITQSMMKLEGQPMTGLFDCCTDQIQGLINSDIF